MQWDLVGISLGICRRDREARWEYAGRSLEEDRKTHRKNTGDYHISGKVTCIRCFAKQHWLDAAIGDRFHDDASSNH
ncbi:hypothetical protein BHM03_00055179 [Ensete ventricosum]|nr:hypothetical protein BHM03_00055179 [Ensete ventricosum]